MRLDSDGAKLFAGAMAKRVADRAIQVGDAMRYSVGAECAVCLLINVLFEFDDHFFFLDFGEDFGEIPVRPPKALFLHFTLQIDGQACRQPRHPGQ